MELDELALSAVQEIGNIGCSNSANSLSKLVESTIMINPPKMGVIPMQDIPKVIANYNDKIIAIYVEIMGNADGALLFVFPYFFGGIIVDSIMGMELDRPEPSEISELTEMDKSAIEEVGNILSGNYLNAICDFMSITLMNTPAIVYFSELTEISLPDSIKYALVIHNQYKIEDVDEPIGDIFLLPDESTIKFMLQSLGVVL